MTQEYKQLVDHYTACFEKHGISAKGVDWPDEKSHRLRLNVMLDVVRPEHRWNCSVLDVGCGYGALLDVIDERQLGINYAGVDLSEPMLKAAHARHPEGRFEQRDIMSDPLPEQSVDYVVMNGVLNEKNNLDYATMEKFAQEIVRAGFNVCKHGLAFNVMSKHVDWERDDLFHWPFDDACAFFTKNVTRHLQIRADYGLYEYTVYLYREPRA